MSNIKEWLYAFNQDEAVKYIEKLEARIEQLEDRLVWYTELPCTCGCQCKDRGTK